MESGGCSTPLQAAGSACIRLLNGAWLNSRLRSGLGANGSTTPPASPFYPFISRCAPSYHSSCLVVQRRPRDESGRRLAWIYVATNYQPCSRPASVWFLSSFLFLALSLVLSLVVSLSLSFSPLSRSQSPRILSAWSAPSMPPPSNSPPRPISTHVSTSSQVDDDDLHEPRAVPVPAPAPAPA